MNEYNQALQDYAACYLGEAMEAIREDEEEGYPPDDVYYFAIFWQIIYAEHFPPRTD